MFAYRDPTHQLDVVGVNVDLTTAPFSALSIRAIRVARSLRLAPFPSTAASIYLLLERRRLHAYTRARLPGRVPRPTRVATRRRARIFLSSCTAGYFSSVNRSKLRRYQVAPRIDRGNGRTIKSNSCCPLSSLSYT